jgi:hypothetical protein
MTENGINLHVWGEGLGLPSIDAESIAAIAYFIHSSKAKPLHWTVEPGHNPALSPNGIFSQIISRESIAQNIQQATFRTFKMKLGSVASCPT